MPLRNLAIFKLTCGRNPVEKVDGQVEGYGLFAYALFALGFPKGLHHAVISSKICMRLPYQYTHSVRFSYNLVLGIPVSK
jgi:hypothetical protein